MKHMEKVMTQKYVVQQFTQNLKTMREKKRIKRIVLSELCGLHPDAIRRYERGEQEPTLSSAAAIADYFGVTIDEMIRIKDFKNST